MLKIKNNLLLGIEYSRKPSSAGEFSRNVLEFKDFCVLLPLILEWNARKFARNTLAMLPVMLLIPLKTNSLPDKPRCFQPDERTRE